MKPSNNSAFNSTHYLIINSVSLYSTIQSSLKTASCPVSTTDSTPATLWPGYAVRALSELEALGRAGVFIHEQTATLTCLTAQWNKGGAHTLEKKRGQVTRLLVELLVESIQVGTNIMKMLPAAVPCSIHSAASLHQSHESLNTGCRFWFHGRVQGKALVERTPLA